MANKLKKKSKPKKNPSKSRSSKGEKAIPQEKEEKISLKELAGDERTWKIIGSISLLISIFLFISFISYLYTWKQDQDKVFRGGFSILLDNTVQVNNLLGKLGALVSHFFIYKGFGLASFLICTFFFVVGVNLLFSRKVFSIWKNLKYVTVGLLVLSVALAFIFVNNDFRFGGGVGAMINGWLIGTLGTIGTGAVLFVFALGYIIWQFNPAFNLPARKELSTGTEEPGVEFVATGESINDAYARQEEMTGNKLTSDGNMLIVANDEGPLHEFKVVEKDEPEDEIEVITPMPEKEIVNDILHQHEIEDLESKPVGEETRIASKKKMEEEAITGSRTGNKKALR
jgi:S-DNA-T family DNA segregation ATPase FtsK/SpoIIIE